MNLKLVLRTYAAYRQMSPDDIALLETLRGMTDDELAYFAQGLQPQKPAGEGGEQQQSTPTKPRKGKCAACPYFKVDPIHHDSTVEGYHVYQPAGKSARAEGMAAAISGSLQRGRQKVNDGACTYVLENGAVCNTGDNNPIHDESFGYAAYHPFQPAAQDAESASTPASSETQPVDAGSAHHAASSGG